MQIDREYMEDIGGEWIFFWLHQLITKLGRFNIDLQLGIPP